MSRIAFYSPLKAPTHPTPSGDREMARGIMSALAMNSRGLAVDLVSQLRCYDGRGDKSLQTEILHQADLEVSRLLQQAQINSQQARWCVWVTYHNYYKAPDLIGPRVCQALNIPYIILEASIAKSRLTGDWAEFAARADNACAQADILLYLTERDRQALEKHRCAGQHLAHFAPFLKQTELPVYDPANKNFTANTLLCVGMHRFGDKFASYEIVAELLTYLQTPDWRLQIVGDGPATAKVQTLFAFVADRVKFLGQLEPAQLAEVYQRATVFVWPGVNEAFGMVYLEAQAAGMPVVAEDRDGVREVIASQYSLVSPGQPEMLAQRIDQILSSGPLQQEMSTSGRQFVQAKHLLGSAAEALSSHLDKVLVA